MLGNLKLILGGALAVVIFGGGYSFGARKVAALEAQIQAIKSASDDAEAKRKKSQEGIDKMLKDKEAEYAKQAQQLKARADQKAKDLAAALAGATAGSRRCRPRRATLTPGGRSSWQTGTRRRRRPSAKSSRTRSTRWIGKRSP